MQKIVFSLLMTFLSFQAFSQKTSTSTSTSSNISISVSSDDNDYSYNARFDSDKTSAAKSVIQKTLGNPTEATDRTAIWEGKGYNVSVRQGKIEMEIDKDAVTKSFQLKIEDLADQVSEAVGSQKTPTPPQKPKAPRN